MVRTYKFNALTQSMTEENPNPRNGNASDKRNAAPQDPGPSNLAAENPGLQQSVQTTPDSNTQCSCAQPFSPFHSPLIDPVGSIVGLRVVYVDGKICYVPVDPQINMLINQQFGGCGVHNSQTFGFARPPLMNWEYAYPSVNPIRQMVQDTRATEIQQTNQNAPVVNNAASVYPAMGTHPNSIETLPATDKNSFVQKRIEPYNNTTERVLQANNQNSMNDNWFGSHPQPKSGVRRSREWNREVDQQPLNLNPSSYNHSVRSPSFAPVSTISTSLPSLNTRGLSDAEKHKLELQRQIEENKMRREMEKQKERELEEREIRRHEEYIARIKREEEDEKRKAREKAQAADIRRMQIHAEQQQQARMARRRSPPREAELERLSTSSSSAPRAVEWWEKKPSWQRDEERNSAVIPTLRGKPPAPPRTPSAGQRSVSRHTRTYDPSSSALGHAREREEDEISSQQRSRRSSSRLSNVSSDGETPTDLNESFRRMSATAAKLNEEQERVQSALSRNDYGDQLFTDSDGRPTAFTIH